MKTNKKFAQKLKRHSYFLRKIKQKITSKDSKANGGGVSKSLKHVKPFSPHSYVTRLNVQNSPITLCKTTSFSLHRNRSRPTGKLTSKGDLSQQHQGKFSISTQMNNFQGFKLPAFASSNKDPIKNRMKAGIPRYVTRLQFIKLKDKLPSLKNRIMNAFKEDKLSKLKRKNRRSLLRRRYITRHWLRIITQLHFNSRSQRSPSKVLRKANCNIEYLSNLQFNGTESEFNEESNLINENSVMNADGEAVKDGEIILSYTDPALKVMDQIDVFREGNFSNASDNFSSSSNVPSSLVAFPDSQNLEIFRKNLDQMNNEEKIINQLKEVKDILINNVNATHPYRNMDKKYLNVDSEISSGGKVPESKRPGVQMAHNSCFTLNQIEEGTNLKMVPKDIDGKEPINGEHNSGDETNPSFLTPIDLSLSTTTECEALNKSKKLIPIRQAAQQLSKFVSEKEINWKVCHMDENDMIEQLEELDMNLTTSASHDSSSNLPVSENLPNTAMEEDAVDERSSTPKLNSLPEDSLNELMEEFRSGHNCSYSQLDQEFSITPTEVESFPVITSNQGSARRHTLQRLSTIVPVTINSSMERYLDGEKQPSFHQLLLQI